MPKSRASPITCGGISRSIDPEMSKLNTMDAVRGTLLVGQVTTRLDTGEPCSQTVTSEAIGRSGEPFWGATMSRADIRVGELNRTANGSTVCAADHAGRSRSRSQQNNDGERNIVTLQHTTGIVVSPYGKSLDHVRIESCRILQVSRTSDYASRMG